MSSSGKSGEGRTRRGAGTTPRPRGGVSIVDLLIAIVIIGILITIIYPRLKSRSAATATPAADTTAAAATAPGGAPAAAAATGTPARLAWTTRPGDAAMAAGDSMRVAVRVEDESGRPLAGVPVEFQVAGSGNVSPPAATSDAAGIVPATWHFGTSAGRVTLTARVRGRPQVASDVAATVRGAP